MTIKERQPATGEYSYEDTGCSVAPSCLSCPLAQCKYDDPAAFYRYLRQKKAVEVHSVMQSEGLTVAEAADRFAVKPDQIRVILRRLNIPITERRKRRDQIIIEEALLPEEAAARFGIGQSRAQQIITTGRR